VDAIIVGFYRGDELTYSARVRAGFTPASRKQVLDVLKPLATRTCPFSHVPDFGAPTRWGPGMSEEKIAQIVWVKPKAVARIEFLEWTSGEHLRHTKFAGLRDDKDPRKVVKET
jgi:ATP-dependent DNA ligase